MSELYDGFGNKLGISEDVDRLKDDLDNYDNGLKTIGGNFDYGSISIDGTITARNDRISSTDFYKFDRKVTLSISDVAVCILCIYEDDKSTVISRKIYTGNAHPEIEAGKYFKISLWYNDTSKVIDIKELSRCITIDTKQIIKLNELESDINNLKK